MISLMRSAIRDSREGRDHEALTKIAKVRSMLDGGGRKNASSPS